MLFLSRPYSDICVAESALEKACGSCISRSATVKQTEKKVS